MGSDLLAVLERLSHLLRSERSEALVRPVHHAILWYLARANRFSDTTTSIAAWLGQTKGTVSVSLRLLQRRGLVVAINDAKDARRRHWRLTPAGAQLIEEAAGMRTLAAAVRKLSPELQAAASEALSTLLSELLRDRGGRVFGICRTCRYFRSGPDGHRCALLNEPLTDADAERYCHEWAAEAVS